MRGLQGVAQPGLTVLARTKITPCPATAGHDTAPQRDWVAPRAGGGRAMDARRRGGLTPDGPSLAPACQRLGGPGERAP